MHKQVYKCPNHTANLNNMRLNNRWCDLIIKVDEKEFPAHKNILAANLQYFDTMLSGDSFRESKEGVITMEFMDATDLEAMITYAYTGEISLTDSNALSMLETANYLGENGIKQACTEFLENHLKVEESFRAYDIAKSIDCLSLKNAAKLKILLNFENSSQSSEYLDLDLETLSDFLSDEKTYIVQSQQIFFEGIMRWILHDAKKRRNRIKDLLSFIDASELPTDYLMKYVGNIASHVDDDSGIVVKDLMSWYYTRSESQPTTNHQVADSEQTLMILGRVAGQFSVQSYNFAERKWSELQVIPTPSDTFIEAHVVLNDKLYFINEEHGAISHFVVFNLSTKLNTVLHSSSSILGWAAMCTCSRFIYMCGGMKEDFSPSAQVLRYDPQTDLLETLPPMPTARAHAAAVFYRGCLHVLGGHDGFSVFDKVEKYDPDTKKWMEVSPICKTRNNHAAVTAVALNGKLYACGGPNNGVQVYDPVKNSWQRVASRKRHRDIFTLVAHKGKLLAIGGTSVEVYDPSKDQWQVDDEMSSGLQVNEC